MFGGSSSGRSGEFLERLTAEQNSELRTQNSALSTQNSELSQNVSPSSVSLSFEEQKFPYIQHDTLSRLSRERMRRNGFPRTPIHTRHTDTLSDQSDHCCAVMERELPFNSLIGFFNDASGNTEETMLQEERR